MTNVLWVCNCWLLLLSWHFMLPWFHIGGQTKNAEFQSVSNTTHVQVLLCHLIVGIGQKIHSQSISSSSTYMVLNLYSHCCWWLWCTQQALLHTVNLVQYIVPACTLQWKPLRPCRALWLPVCNKTSMLFSYLCTTEDNKGYNWRARKQSGLTHKCWICPPNMRIPLKYVSGPAENFKI